MGSMDTVHLILYLLLLIDIFGDFNGFRDLVSMGCLDIKANLGNNMRELHATRESW